MSKHGFLDIKKNTSVTIPDSGYTRIKANTDDTFSIITDAGVVSPLRGDASETTWRLPVIASNITDPSTITPNAGDRYIVPTVAIGIWSGEGNNIAEWDGSAWQFFTPEQGWAVYLKSDETIYSFNLTLAKWVDLILNPLKEFSKTLDATDITNAYLDIGETVNEIHTFIIQGAPPQSDGVDYEIDGGNNNRVTWNGLILDGQLITGNIVNIKYK